MRRPNLGESLAIAAGLVVFAYAGWDGALWDARWQLGLHLLAIGAIAGLVGVARAGGLLPRTRIDVPMLVLLAAFALATVSAENDGLALRAMASIVATAAMLPVGLVVLRRRPGWVALAAIGPTLGLALGTLVVMLGRRVEWLTAGAPGLPPIRMLGEGSPFGSVAVAPFALLALVPLALVLHPPRFRAWTLAALGVIGAPMTILSGSRSAWLAIAAAGLAFAATHALRGGLRMRLPSRWTPRNIGLLAAGIGLSALAVAYVTPRVLSTTSLIYRGNLWADTLAAWSADPILGIGPGTMPYARQAAAAPMSFPVQQPHSHNLPLGVLGDAGLVGLAAAVVLVIWFAMVAGPWRSRSVAGRAASSVLLGIGIGGLFEDLTFLPNFNLLVILCAAVALSDAGAVDWRPIPPLRPVQRLPAAAATLAAGFVLLLGMIVGDAGAIAYRAGVQAFGMGDRAEAARWFERAVELDPWHPAGPKALAVAADAAGDAPLALDAALRAVELYPGDGASWANLAVLCLRQGDSGCAADAARRATNAATLFGREAINAARVFEELGSDAAADDAYRLSLLTNRITSLATDWPRRLTVSAPPGFELDRSALELNLVLAGVEAGNPLDPGSISDPAVRALAAALSGDRPAAESALTEAIARQPASLATWEMALLLREHWGEPTDDARQVYAAVRGSPPPNQHSRPGLPGLDYDIATFRIFPLDGFLMGAEHLVLARPWPWVLEELLP